MVCVESLSPACRQAGNNFSSLFKPPTLQWIGGFFILRKGVRTMENNVLINQGQAFGSDQILKLTALLYLKEALVAQEYESCQELVDTAKNLGIDQGDISAVITDYLNADNPGRQKISRLRSIQGG
jgi:hypothetical protein